MSDKSVYLEKGEVIPVFCECGNIYQPEAGSSVSVCMKCERRNHHDTGRTWRRNEPKGAPTQ